MTDEERSRESVQLLVQRARHGDEDAFGELMQLYYQKSYALAYRMVNHVEDARDLAQQSWVKAWKSLDQFRGDAQFYTWLYRIVSSVCLDFRRSKARHPEVVTDEEGLLEKPTDLAR